LTNDRGEIPEANAFSDGVDRPVVRRSALGRVFAQDDLGVNEDIVWQVVTVDLPKLVDSLEPLVPPSP